MEELDWSAERPVLIPAEHLWCDFKCRPWAKNSSPNTNDLYIHYMDKSTGTPPSLEEKKALPNRGNKDGNIIHVLKNCIFTSVAKVLKRMKWCTHMSLVFGDEYSVYSNVIYSCNVRADFSASLLSLQCHIILQILSALEKNLIIINIKKMCDT